VAEPAPGRPRTVGLLGGGVIGGGWAARFIQHGVDVRVYDPDPRAAENVAAVLENSRRAWARLTLAPLPGEGRLEIVPTVEEAVAGADFVQENAPEREPLKRELLARADRAAAADAVFCSSTSGLRPSLLQADMDRPGRFAVGHPFNPVYLLPLVEVCGGERTDRETLERAAAVYRSIGMEPLVLRAEIDGFIADRLMEAMWREALWLVADDVATAAEIDDAVRLGAGLRWSFMGSFLTYRAAGGEEGMRHFMEQFGPTLRWPWTKLTDVPELTDELVEKLVAQSDAQAAGRSARELEELRDDCLVSVLQGLRANHYGAGAVLEQHERRLFAAAGAAAATAPDTTRPLALHEATVLPEWVDYNGHAHESRYLQVLL
jgi:carnitine 3-dehydrogenase